MKTEQVGREGMERARKKERTNAQHREKERAREREKIEERRAGRERLAMRDPESKQASEMHPRTNCQLYSHATPLFLTLFCRLGLAPFDISLAAISTRPV